MLKVNEVENTSMLCADILNKGIDLRTEAYTVFNLGDHHEEEIGVYCSLITVDEALVDYFNNFENRGGFTYENGRAVYVALLDAANHREKMEVARQESSHNHREKVEEDSNSQTNRRRDYSMV